MKSVIVAMILSLLVAACSNTRLTQTLDQTTVTVVNPPKSLYNCPQVGKIPDPETLTNQEVADFIEKLYRYQKICKINIEKIRQYVERANRIHNK